VSIGRCQVGPWWLGSDLRNDRKYTPSTPNFGVEGSFFWSGGNFVPQAKKFDVQGPFLDLTLNRGIVAAVAELGIRCEEIGRIDHKKDTHHGFDGLQ